jgi:hypothetical protein
MPLCPAVQRGLELVGCEDMLVAVEDVYGGWSFPVENHNEGAAGGDGAPGRLRTLMQLDPSGGGARKALDLATHPSR